MQQDIRQIVSNFRIEGSYIGIETVVNGHINDSYSIITTSSDQPSYFLQRINTHVFKDIEGLMGNVAMVIAHLKSKLKNNPAFHLDFQIPDLIPTQEGKNYFFDDKENCWRLYNYIPDTHTFNVVNNLDVAFQGGLAFGTFLSLLSDLPAERLKVTIPDFHNIKKRLEAFHISVLQNSMKRVECIQPQIRFVNERLEKMIAFYDLIEKGKLPLRITHNDTKFNNILFNSSDQAVSIVDLDTVMPGSILFDYGDAIRTVANTAAEDEEDLEKVRFNRPVYEAYTQGFLENTKETLNDCEMDNLYLSAQYMTYIIGLRFLTDYINGDTYFRITREYQNLERAKVQFRFVELMEEFDLGLS